MDDRLDDTPWARLWQQVFATVLTRLGNVEDAEDITQLAILSAIRQAAFRGESSYGSYLTAIALRRAADLIRTRIRERRHLERYGHLLEQRPDPDLAGRVCAIMARLPPNQRLALHLRYALRWPPRRTARYLGIPFNTLEPLLHRAKRAFGLLYSTANDWPDPDMPPSASLYGAPPTSCPGSEP